MKKPAQCAGFKLPKEHVIARRAQPDVAIPYLFVPVFVVFHFYLRDSHASVRTGSE